MNCRAGYHCIRGLLLIAIAVLPAWSQPVHAQATQERPQVTRQEPGFIYLLGKDGKPILIPNVSLEEYTRMYDLANGLQRPQQPPAFLLEELKLECEADGDRATFEATLTLQILRSGRYVIPIEFGGGQLISQPTMVTPSATSVRANYNLQSNGYELILNGDEGINYEVRIEGMIPLRRIARESRLRLRLPRTTVSTLRIKVPEVDLQYESVSALDFSTTEEETHTLFTARGLESNFVFGWRPRETMAADDAPPLEVTTIIGTQISATSITSDVRVSVTGLRQPVEQLTMRLPPNSTLLDSDRTDYQIRTSQTDGDRPTAEVIFQEPELAPVIHLRVQNATQVGEASTLGPYALDAYEVDGALRHTGTIRAVSTADWTLQWMQGDFGRRVNDPEAARGVSTFEFFQPNQIKVGLSRQKTELSVEPIYVVELQESEILLTAYFRCRTRGSTPPNLLIETGAWSLDRPEAVLSDIEYVEADVDAQNDQGQAVIPLLLQGPSKEFIVRMQARQIRDSLTPNPSDIKIELPVPTQVDQLRQSTVVITKATNVYAATNASETSYAAISPDDVAGDVLPDGMPDATDLLCLRSQSGGPPPHLLLRANTIERVTSFDCEAEIVEVTDDTIHIRQTMRWKVDNVALTRALLSVGEDVMHGDLLVTIDSEKKVVTQLSSFNDLVNRPSVEVTLPAAGSFEMVVDYQSKLPPPGEDGIQRLDLSLVIPQENLTSRLADNWKFYFLEPNIPGHEITLGPLDDAWTSPIATIDPEVETRSLLASTEDLLRFIPLDIRKFEAKDEPNNFEMIVEQAWFQTWYTTTARQDRTVFHISGAGDQVRVTLPDMSNVEQLHCWVDGSLSPVEGWKSRSFELSLAPDTTEHTIEIIYTSATREPPGTLRMPVPRVDQANMVGQWMWHVVLPLNECLVSSHKSLTSAHRWSWNSWFPRGQSQLSQSQLEAWIGAMRLDRKKLWGSSELLFSSVGPVEEQISITTTTLSVYLLSTVGSILILGLLLIYIKKSQRVALLGIIGILLFAITLFNPSLAAIAGQSAVLGVALIVLASMLAFLHQQAALRTLVTEAQGVAGSIARTDDGSGFTGGSTTRLGIGSVARSIDKAINP